MDTSDEWISSRTGIKQRHISKSPGSTSDGDREVAEACWLKGALWNRLILSLWRQPQTRWCLPQQLEFEANIGRPAELSPLIWQRLQWLCIPFSQLQKSFKFWTEVQRELSGLRYLSRQLIGQIVQQLFSLGTGGVLEAKRNTSLPCGKNLYYGWL